MANKFSRRSPENAELLKIPLCDNTVKYFFGNKKKENQNNLSLPPQTN